MYYEITVTGKLNVTGVPDANGVLPKLIGAGHNRHFLLEEESDVLTLRRLNLTGGNVYYSTISNTGGSVSISSGKLFAYSCIFSKNTGRLGGAVYARNKESSVFLNITDFESNVAIKKTKPVSY